VAKPNLGEKHDCPNCETRFFDLGKQSPSCPKCATVINPIKPGSKSKLKATAKAAPELVAKDSAEKADEVDEIEGLSVSLPLDDATDDLDSDEDDDGLMEDTSDLGDDDDITAVINTGESADG